MFEGQSRLGEFLSGSYCCVVVRATAGGEEQMKGDDKERKGERRIKILTKGDAKERKGERKHTRERRNKRREMIRQGKETSCKRREKGSIRKEN